MLKKFPDFHWLLPITPTLAIKYECSYLPLSLTIICILMHTLILIKPLLHLHTLLYAKSSLTPASKHSLWAADSFKEIVFNEFSEVIRQI